MASLAEQVVQLESMIAAQEAMRSTLGDTAVNTALVALRGQLVTLRGQQQAAALRPALVPNELGAKLRAAGMKHEGERKPVTILFADIVGSTALAEQLDVEEWKLIVGDVHTSMMQAVSRYEGFIAQMLGDGLLAFFGAPLTHEDDPERAVRAGLEIQQGTRAIADDLRRAWGIENFQVRVGLNTGEVVLGALGSDLHAEYLAIGDAVNLAARIQSAAQPGTLLISGSTHRHVQARFECTTLGPIQVKGREQPLQVFEVVRAKAVPARARGIEGLTSPLVGRERELAVLHECLDELRAGRGQIVSVIGEPGLGKSRLIEDARNSTSTVGALADSAAQPQSVKIHWLEGRALAYGQSLSFWSVTQLLKADLGVSDADPEARVRISLRRRVNALFGARTPDVLPYLAHLLGLKLEEALANQIKVLDGETLKRQTLLSLGEYFTRAAENRPTVLIFEDLHWADPSSLEALEQWMPITDRAPLMLLMLFRPERDHGAWHMKLKAETEFAHRYHELALLPLVPQAAEQLVNNLLAVSDLPSSMRDLILNKSEGNPFYLEEVIRSLTEQGALVRDAATGRWHGSYDIAYFNVPDTLQGVLLARIDRLREDVRHTLQLASVIGRSFLYRILAAIDEADRQLDQRLSQLQRADLVREKMRRPELEYIFRHSLTQEAAYNSLLVERRREFHRKVGEAMERLFAERAEEFYGMLAHHFDRAGERVKAVQYLIQAGDKARLSDAHEEAKAFYRRAIELLGDLGDPERMARTWLKLGLIHHANFDFAAAYQANEAAFALQRNTQLAPDLQPSPTPLRFAWPVALQLDPGRWADIFELCAMMNIFAGLAAIDDELNVVPHLARSWEVLDDGLRYLIHLRDDARWSDGAPVTAHDCEWTWKRNLRAGLNEFPARLMDEVVGARDYREGRNPDPQSVGVHALDPWTLEVRLATPVVYFPYLLAMCNAYPLPRQTVEQFGADWWKPEHLVSSGAFRLVEFEPERRVVLERNRDYFAQSDGNVSCVEWQSIDDPAERTRCFRDNLIDACTFLRRDLPPEIGPHTLRDISNLGGLYLAISPRPPLDDVGVRRALAMALKRDVIAQAHSAMPARGGVIPPGIAGHTPELGFAYDLAAAQQLMRDARLALGADMQTLTGMVSYPTNLAVAQFLEQQWRVGLGLQVKFNYFGPTSAQGFPEPLPHFFLSPWVADYPDPDSFMRQFTAHEFLQRAGWREPRFEALVAAAARTGERARRMALYREAERTWVAEQTVVIPLFYWVRSNVLVSKPWVKNLGLLPLGQVFFKDVILETR